MMMVLKMPRRSQKNFTLWVLAVLLLGISIVTSAATPLKKRSLVAVGRSGDPEVPSTSQKLRPPNKRTFCNAFTGCGRKRSDGSMPQSKDYEYEHETPLVETPSDDGVDDVARDILAEARLWEALQARSSIRSPYRRQPGFFPRQKRETSGNQSDVNRN